MIILVGVVINLGIGEDGIFNKAKYASEQYINEQEKEKMEIAKYSNQIDTSVSGTREQITVDKEQYESLLNDVATLKQKEENRGKTVIWTTSGTRTVEVNLSDYNANITDYDFLIVYYSLINHSGDVVFTTTENGSATKSYSLTSSAYSIWYITTDIENNKIRMSGASGNTSNWATSGQLLKIVGVNL